MFIKAVKQQIRKWKDKLRIFNASQKTKMLVVTHGSAAMLLQTHVLVGDKVFGMTSIM